MGVNYFTKTGLPAFVCFLLLILAGSVNAATLNVPSVYPTIQSAIDAAVDGDTVLVDDGTYHETINLKGKKITVRSVHGPDYTTIDSDDTGSVVICDSGETVDTVLDGFTITDGYADKGGGIYWKGVSPRI